MCVCTLNFEPCSTPPEAREAAEQLYWLSQLINQVGSCDMHVTASHDIKDGSIMPIICPMQAIGDAISDLLTVEAILAIKKVGSALSVVTHSNYPSPPLPSPTRSVLVVSLFLQWTCKTWADMYLDLPNRLRKAQVPDRTLFKTTDAERQCTSPPGLQQAIDVVVKQYERGRSFVRQVSWVCKQRKFLLFSVTP